MCVRVVPSYLHHVPAVHTGARRGSQTPGNNTQMVIQHLRNKPRLSGKAAS